MYDNDVNSAEMLIKLYHTNLPEDEKKKVIKHIVKTYVESDITLKEIGEMVSSNDELK